MVGVFQTSLMPGWWIMILVIHATKGSLSGQAAARLRDCGHSYFRNNNSIPASFHCYC